MITNGIYFGTVKNIKQNKHLRNACHFPLKTGEVLQLTTPSLLTNDSLRTWGCRDMSSLASKQEADAKGGGWRWHQHDMYQGIGKDVPRAQRNYSHGKSLYKPYIIWVFMDYNP